jgi:hypothetical protein
MISGNIVPAFHPFLHLWRVYSVYLMLVCTPVYPCYFMVWYLVCVSIFLVLSGHIPEYPYANVSPSGISVCLPGYPCANVSLSGMSVLIPRYPCADICV